MVKVFSTVILVFLLVFVDLSFAQSQNNWASKVYSGYFHQNNVNNNGSFWHVLFGGRTTKKKEDYSDWQCAIVFKSPVGFSNQTVIEIPKELTYFIKFKNGDQTSGGNAVNNNLNTFTIKIYTNDDQDYSIDPNEEDKQIGINGEHHIYDQYLIYLILGSSIDHLEIVNPSGEDKGKYILDKLEIRN